MQGILSVIGVEGDVKTSWSKDSPVEVEVARAAFDTLKAKGYLAFSVEERGEKGSKIDEFDPNLERIIMFPPVVGG